MLKTENIYDQFYNNSSLAYITEAPDDENNVEDKSIEGKPISKEIKENSKHKGVIGKIGGIGANSNEPTRNGRRYPLELWQNVEKSDYFIEGMKNRTLIGEADHPNERVDYSVKEGAVVLTEYKIQDDGTVYTEFDILDTIPGRTVKTYFDAGCKLGVSSRGLGEELMVDGETIIDPETYQFYCFDVVAFPAVKTARMELLESTSTKRQSLINSINSEINKCKSLDEILFIESMSKGVNLYLDEIKEAVEIKKKSLNDQYGNDSAKDIVNYAKEILKKLNSENVEDNEKDKTFKDGLMNLIKDYVESPVIENLLNELKEEDKNTNEEKNNKIELSEGNTISSEDTDEEYAADDNKIILMEIQSENNSLKDELSKRNELIKSLLADKASKNKKIQENANIFNKLFNSNKQLINENKEIKSSLKEHIAIDKLTLKYNNLQKINQQFSSMLESLNNDNKNLDEQNSSLKKRNESLEKSSLSLRKENKSLKESNINNEKRFSSLNESLTTKINQKSSKINSLNESIKDLKSINAELEQNNKSILKENESLKESIKFIKSNNIEKDKIVKASLDKYIEMTCLKYNLNESTLKRRLGKNYTTKDIDMIAEELSDNISKINSLPFANISPERQIIHENIGLINKKSNNSDIEENLEIFNMGLIKSN